MKKEKILVFLLFFFCSWIYGETIKTNSVLESITLEGSIVFDFDKDDYEVELFTRLGFSFYKNIVLSTSISFIGGNFFSLYYANGLHYFFKIKKWKFPIGLNVGFQRDQIGYFNILYLLIEPEISVVYSLGKKSFVPLSYSLRIYKNTIDEFVFENKIRLSIGIRFDIPKVRKVKTKIP